MASSASKQAQQGKVLKELLQEQQEPFMLDIYLLERGLHKKPLNSDGAASACCPGNSSNCCKRFDPSTRRMRRRIPNYPKILRTVLNKLGSSNETQKLPNREGVISLPEMGGMATDPVAESDRFSSASSMTVFESCSESNPEEQSPSSPSTNTFRALKLCNLREQAATDMKLRWECMGDSKQLSPVSVLEGLTSSSDEGSPVHKNMQNHRRKGQEVIPSTSIFNAPRKLVTEDSIFSASMWELLIQSQREKQGSNGFCSSSDQYFFKTKRVLQQTKQLLFDCVKEAIEIHEKKGRRRRRRYVKELMGAEEIGKIICDQISSWGRQSAELTNITQLIVSDLSASTEEWSDFQPQIREISIEMGDAILEDIMKEIVKQIIDFFSLNTR